MLYLFASTAALLLSPTPAPAAAAGGVAHARAAAPSMILGGLLRKGGTTQITPALAAVKGVVVPTGLTITPMSESEVRAAQRLWASSIQQISKTYLDGGDYVAAAGAAAGELYAYGHSNVLFKPTKAKEVQFRPMASDAMSYFVGKDAVEDGYDEDGGFAINGGKGWADVSFDNHQIEINGNTAIAMGNYYFTCATTGEKSTVEYTFGYNRCDDGKVRIFLHHSSVPYSA